MSTDRSLPDCKPAPARNCSTSFSLSICEFGTSGGNRQAFWGSDEQYKNVDQTSLIALASWLNSHGQYERELETIPRERAMQTRELFFQHVDALGALGRWDEIGQLIESEQIPLDPVIEHMYLARCFAQQNQMSGAANNWKRALKSAAGDVNKLMTLADYAEKNGALNVAAAAYDAAVAVSPKVRPAQQGRLRVAYIQRDTRKIHEILADLLKVWPNDTAVQNDEAYARLLLMPNDSGSSPDKNAQELREIESLAAKLVERNQAVCRIAHSWHWPVFVFTTRKMRWRSTRTLMFRRPRLAPLRSRCMRPCSKLPAIRRKPGRNSPSSPQRKCCQKSGGWCPSSWDLLLP